MNQHDVNRATELMTRVHWCLEHGFSFLPTDGKKAAIPWKPFTKRHPTMQGAQLWFRDGKKNIAIIAGQISRLICIDTDERQMAVTVYKTLPRTEMMVRTPRGVHFWFRMTEEQQISPKVKLAGLDVDIRGENSYALCPPSLNYEQIGSWDLEKVPFFVPEWLELLAPGHSKAFSSSPSSPKKINDLSAYLRSVPSHQGKGGQ